MDHNLKLAAGYGKIKCKKTHRPCHQEEGKDDAQQVDQPSPLVPDQGDIGYTEGDGENQDKGGSEKHEVSGSPHQIIYDIIAPVDLRPGQHITCQKKIGNHDREAKEGKSEIHDRIIGVGVIMNLLNKSPEQEYDRCQCIENDQDTDYKSMLLPAGIDQERYNRCHDQAQDQQGIKLGFASSGIESKSTHHIAYCLPFFRPPIASFSSQGTHLKVLITRYSCRSRDGAVNLNITIIPSYRQMEKKKNWGEPGRLPLFVQRGGWILQ